MRRGNDRTRARAYPTPCSLPADAVATIAPYGAVAAAGAQSDLASTAKPSRAAFARLRKRDGGAVVGEEGRRGGYCQRKLGIEFREHGASKQRSECSTSYPRKRAPRSRAVMS